MPEFHLLLERLFDGGLRGDERERFNAILRQDRQARREWVEQIEIHARLSRFPDLLKDSGRRVQMKQGGRWRWLPLAATVVVLLSSGALLALDSIQAAATLQAKAEIDRSLAELNLAFSAQDEAAAVAAETATGCAPRYAAVGNGAAAEAAECAPDALAEGFLKDRFLQTSVALSGIASATAATNLWLGTVAAEGYLPSPDFAANWSLDRVPDRENLDCACVATNLVIDDSVISFAPLTLFFKGTWQGYRLEFQRDFELQRLECQDGTAGSAEVHAGRVQVGTANRPVTLALSGGTAPLDFRQSSSGWNYVRLAPGSVIDFCGEEIAFPKSNVGKTSSDGAIQSSGYFEDAACSSNGTIRFSTAAGTIRLAGQGLDKGAIRLGYNNLELRSDQTWIAEPTAYVSLNARQTPEGAKGPVFPIPLDSKRLDNLGQVNFSVCGQPLADATPLTGLHLSGGTYGSLHFCSSGTTRRRQCIALDGDVALLGEVVETPMQSGGEAQTRPYSLTLATYTSPGSLSLHLEGNALELANGLRLDAGATGDDGSFCRIDASGGILRIGGDLIVSDAAHPGAAEHGIHLDASSTLELGGDYHTSQTSV
ncbi:MAG: hypothetical protein ACI4X9_03510, partial [Kiritimatiellia bacterium]